VAAAAGFIRWLTSANTFCSTLVDRIVTGYPRDEVAALEAQTGYKDAFLIPPSISTCLLSRGLPRWRPSCVSINCR
jgi:hypothetical protein